ncbi:MAG: hypothetical protein Kow00128_14460 [Deltaproteobacteria bacterium]
MADQDPKGFRVVDKRGIEREEPPAAPPAAKEPAPAPGAEGATGETGNRAAPSGVHEKKRPDRRGSSLAGPTFLDLVMTLQMGAMVNLGMVQTPEGQRTPVNLPAAKDSIDMLEVLQAKTKGNLDDEEREVLSEGMYHLRMAYVAAVNAEAGAPGGGRDKGGAKR